MVWFILVSLLVEYFKVDDPLDAFAVHGGAGSWGVLALGLFHTELGAFTVLVENYFLAISRSFSYCSR